MEENFQKYILNDTKPGFVSFSEKKCLAPSQLADLKEKNVEAVREREAKFSV